MATVFKYSGSSDDTLTQRSGQTVRVVRHLSDVEVDPEVGDMYRVEFADGVQRDVFADELYVE